MRVAIRIAEAMSFIRKERMHCIPEGEEVGRSLDHVVEAGSVIGGIAGVHQHRSGWRSHFDDLGHLCAGHARHEVIRYDHVVDCRIEQGERFLRRSRGIHGIPEVGQKPLGRDASIILIIHEEDHLYRG